MARVFHDLKKSVMPTGGDKIFVDIEIPYADHAQTPITFAQTSLERRSILLQYWRA